MRNVRELLLFAMIALWANSAIAQEGDWFEAEPDYPGNYNGGANPDPSSGNTSSGSGSSSGGGAGGGGGGGWGDFVNDPSLDWDDIFSANYPVRTCTQCRDGNAFPSDFGNFAWNLMSINGGPCEAGECFPTEVFKIQNSQGQIVFVWFDWGSLFEININPDTALQTIFVRKPNGEVIDYEVLLNGPPLPVGDGTSAESEGSVGAGGAGEGQGGGDGAGAGGGGFGIGGGGVYYPGGSGGGGCTVDHDDSGSTVTCAAN